MWSTLGRWLPSCKCLDVGMTLKLDQKSICPFSFWVLCIFRSIDPLVNIIITMHHHFSPFEFTILATMSRYYCCWPWLTPFLILTRMNTSCWYLTWYNMIYHDIIKLPTITICTMMPGIVPVFHARHLSHVVPWSSHRARPWWLLTIRAWGRGSPQGQEQGLIYG